MGVGYNKISWLHLNLVIEKTCTLKKKKKENVSKVYTCTGCIQDIPLPFNYSIYIKLSCVCPYMSEVIHLLVVIGVGRE